MTSLNILSIQRLSDNERAMIAAVDDSVNLTVAGGWFDGEIRDTWPEFAANRYLPAGPNVANFGPTPTSSSVVGRFPSICAPVQPR
jgi:hypothetical protein